MNKLGRDDVIARVTWALRKAPLRHKPNDVEIAATAKRIVDHLETSGVTFRHREIVPHRSPPPEGGDPYR